MNSPSSPASSTGSSSPMTPAHAQPVTTPVAPPAPARAARLLATQLPFNANTASPPALVGALEAHVTGALPLEQRTPTNPVARNLATEFARAARASRDNPQGMPVSPAAPIHWFDVLRREE
ncbi:hypothetical protein [Limnobacter sp.]|uniref:hypothetical protein n=1 Tax=Limnobacter sp. TaxID=2003368 RepID=UPI0035193FEB